MSSFGQPRYRKLNLEELTAVYVEVRDESGKNEAIVIEESETIEKKVQRVIEAGHANCNKNSPHAKP